MCKLTSSLDNIDIRFNSETGKPEWSQRGADSFSPFSSKPIDLGTGTSFDLTTYSGYENFTVDNFIVTFESWSRQEQRNYNNNVTIKAAAVGVIVNAGSFNVKKTYTDGILKISYSGISVIGSAANVNANATIKPTCRVYLVA